MPKVHDTRRQRANELLKHLERGPAFDEVTNKPWDDSWDGFPAQYKRWCESWIIPVVKELVPELKKGKQPNE